MPRLPWIDDDNLVACVNHLLNKAKAANDKVARNFGKNVIDPFSALFEISGFEMEYAVWHKSETARQAQKTLQNHIGEFHQKILGSVEGWTDMKTGGVIDIISHDKKIIAEVKNKYNTVSGGRLADTYTSLCDLVMPKTSIYKGYTAYFVAIIPKRSTRYDKPFTPSDKSKGERCSTNEMVREMDGASFYQLVTGDEKALEDLFNVLPDVINENAGFNFDSNDKEKLKLFFDKAYKE